MKKAIQSMILVVVAIGALPFVTSCAWWQKHGNQTTCAAITAVENAPQLLAIVKTCAAISTVPAAILSCAQGAAGSKWAADAITCFMGSAAGLTRCPAAEIVMSAKPSDDVERGRLQEALRNHQFTR